jgi:DNA-binding protein HU-beta
MNKTQLTDRLADDADIMKKQAAAALKSLLDSITDELVRDNKIMLADLGTFSIFKRRARNGRNPLTGKSIKIRGRKMVKFKAGKEFSEAVLK